MEFESVTLVVAGMHRSGTSLTASLLQAAGIDMGKNMVGIATGNRKGHFEDADFVQFHKALLISEGVHSDGFTLDAQIPVKEHFRQSAVELVSTRLQYGLWGWKDPRTTLFLDFWDSLIPNAFYVMVYRAPWEVTDSLYRRDTDEIFRKNPEMAVELWMHYTRKILAFCERNPARCLLINASRVVENPSALISGIDKKFGITLTTPGSSMVDRTIFNDHASYTAYPALISQRFPEVIDLYRDLEIRAHPLHGTPGIPKGKLKRGDSWKINTFREWQLHAAKNPDTPMVSVKTLGVESSGASRSLFSRIRGRIKHHLLERQIRRSGYLDELYYLQNNPDVRDSGMGAATHFLRYGGNEGRNPSREFETLLYLDLNPGVQDTGINPLVHYLKSITEKSGSGIVEPKANPYTVRSKTEPEPEETGVNSEEVVIENSDADDLQLIRDSEYFNAAFYLKVYPDVEAAGIDPAEHYFYHGWKEGRSTGNLFDLPYYVYHHPEVAESGVCPLAHFLKTGKDEGWLPKPARTRERPRFDLKNQETIQYNILFIAHDLHRAGSEMLLLNILSWLRQYTSVQSTVLALHRGHDGGKLLPEYQKVSVVFLWEELYHGLSEAEKSRLLYELFGHVDLIYGNTLLAANLYPHLNLFTAPIVSHLHELEESIQKYTSVATREYCKLMTSRFIACSLPVKENLVQNHGIDQKRIEVIHAFIRTEADQQKEHQAQHPLPELPKGIVKIWGCGTIYRRKGTDLFIETAIRLRDRGFSNFVFCWIGGNYWDMEENETGAWDKLVKRIADHGMTGSVIFPGERENPGGFFNPGDIFFLPSREDPFPLVCLEAAFRKLPVVCFEKAGGIPDFVESDAGFVLPFLDVNAAADAIGTLIDHENIRLAMGRTACRKARERHTDHTAVPEILKVCHELLQKGNNEGELPSSCDCA